MRSLLVLLFSACACVPAVGCADDGIGPRDTAELSILFVGNSLTMSNDLPGMVSALLDSVGAGPTLVFDQSVPGTGLEDHWSFGRAVDRIRSGGWDYVVLQQGPSATEGRPSLLEYAQRFAVEIRAAGAVPVVYMVWPAESRSFDFDGVSDSYREAARLSGALLVPAGDVWRAGWERDRDLGLYDLDRFHPSELGTYAAAVTMAAALSDRSPSTFPHRFQTPRGEAVAIPDASAATVKAAAAEVLGR